MIYLRFVILVSVLLFCSEAFSQARLEVVNNSERSLYVKIMHQGGGLFETMTVNAYSSNTQYFQETGYYYLKTKGTKKGLKSIFKKGNAFRVYNGSDGYSVLTVTYSISGGVSTAGKEISESEFNKN